MDEAQTCSDFCQSAHTAMLSTKGPYKGKGKGKGHKGRYPVRPSNLSIEDRRRKLQELKSKTECKDCGKKGHWKGDKQCTMTKTAHIATNHINAASNASSSATAATTDLVRSSGKGKYRQPVHNSGRKRFGPCFFSPPPLCLLCMPWREEEASLGPPTLCSSRGTSDHACSCSTSSLQACAFAWKTLTIR